MTALLLLSIGLRLAALVWSLVLLRRLRDWRMGLLSAMLLLMAARQSLTLRHHLLSGVAGIDPWHGALVELPGVLVSVLGLAFVVLLDRLLVSRSREAADRRSVEGALKESEERFRALSESTPDVIFTVAADGTVTSLSPAVESLTGWPASRWIGRSFSDLVSPEDVEAARDLFRRLAAGESFSRFELRITDRDGELRVGELAVTPEFRGGEFAGALGIARDITEPKRVEWERDAALSNFQRIAEVVPDCFFSTVPDGEGGYRVDFVSAGWKKIWGYEPEDLYRDSGLWIETVLQEDRAEAQGTFDRVASERRPLTVTYRIHDRSGRLRWIEDAMSPIFDGEGRLVGVDGIARDITESRQSLQALHLVAQAVSGKTGEDFFRTLVIRLTEALGLEHALVGELGVAEQEAVQTIAAVLGGELTENFEYPLAGTPCENVLGRQLCCYADGVTELFPRDAMLSNLGIKSYVGMPLADSAGRPLGLLAVMGSRPIERPAMTESVLRIFAVRAAAELERKRAEEALAQSEERYRSLFEESQDAIFISTIEGKLVDINPAGVALFGYDSKEELLEVDIGRDLYWDRWERDRLLRLMAGEGYVRDRELKLRRRDGSKLVVLESATAVRDESGRILACRGVLRDVTHQRELEEQLQQAQRMEAVGRLAGGVAEDFEKVLAVLRSRSDRLLERLAPDDPLTRHVAEIQAAGRRAETLTHQLQILGRRRQLQPRRVDLNRLVGEMEKLLHRVVGESVQLVVRLGAETGEVNADPREVEEMLLNLAINARDAMAGGGTLSVETAEVEVDREQTRRQLGLSPGPYVVLRIEDTGRGFDPRTREHMFEPFFAADGSGDGGLGLATVYGIVEQSGGSIRVDSDPERGTAFEIYLPRVAMRQSEAEPPEPEAVPTGGGTVLLAEDETAVREMLRGFLVERGYRVMEAADGEQALALATEAAGAIDLLITDMVMPGIGGIDLAHRMGGANPELRVLFMSGYTEDPTGFLDSGSLKDRTGFLRKPFSTRELSEKLREILDGS